MQTDEVHIADAINIATEEISGSGKGISNAPLTLVVMKNGFPDLTMADLSGISRVPVHGSLTTSSGIRTEESIILNILHASVDFTTFESIRVSRQVDYSCGYKGT